MPANQENEREVEKRDIELENIIGNLMIAEYQVDRLRNRVAEKLAGKYLDIPEKKLSTHVFKHDGRWFKISVKAQEIDIDQVRANQATK